MATFGLHESSTFLGVSYVFYYLPELYLFGKSWWMFTQVNVERRLGGASNPTPSAYTLWHFHGHVTVLVETLGLLVVWQLLFWGQDLSSFVLVDLYTATFSSFFLVKAAVLAIHGGLFLVFFNTHRGHIQQKFPAWWVHLWTIVTVSLLLLVGTYHLLGMFVLLELYTVGVAILFTWEGSVVGKGAAGPSGFPEKMEQVVRYLLTNLHVTLYFLLFVYLVYQQTGSLSALHLSLSAKASVLLMPEYQPYYYALYALVLVYLFFKLALFPFLTLYARLLAGVSKEVLMYYLTVPKIVLLCLSKKIFFLFCWTHAWPSWWLGMLVGVGLWTIAWSSLKMFQQLTIPHFFIYSSFGTTGFLFLNFLLPPAAHLMVLTYLYLYLGASLTLFALWYVADDRSGSTLVRWDQPGGALGGSPNDRAVVAGLFLSLGTFSPFSAFLIKYVFLWGWVMAMGSYGWVLGILLVSALNSLAYFYWFYLMVHRSPSSRGLWGSRSEEEVPPAKAPWVQLVRGVSWVQLGLLLSVPFLGILEGYGWGG